MAQPTVEAYAELQKAFDHFNQALFDGALPSCLISLRTEGSSMGYFSGSRFVGRATGEVVDEIAMHAGYFGVMPIREIMQTVVHEMVHQWQHHHGTPGRGRYHNREWAAKMEAIGLMPSDTGEPGGSRTGDCVSDYMIEGGPFEAACGVLLTQEYTLSWMDRFPPVPPEAAALAAGDGALQAAVRLVKLPEAGVKPNKSNRVKYRCPKCGAQAWGKAALALLCGAEGCEAAPLEAVVAGDVVDAPVTVDA
ncbi:MAG: zinc metalloprotease [Rhodospirillaceae bacterium BRH_c57]|nr:MAG: zinc metalloprotease [Rhodospirillaceae bacterium BRH_c57]